MVSARLILLASLSFAGVASAATPLVVTEAREVQAPTIVGVGLVLTAQDHHIMITGLLANSPAKIDGSLQTGDEIVGVKTDDAHDWQALTGVGLGQAAQLIRGPEDSEVGLRILRNGAAVPEDVYLNREVLVLPKP